MTGPAQGAFDALSDPTRREILRLLAAREEMAAGEIADEVSSVGRTAVSSHLRVLRQAGLVVERREGRFRYLALDPEGPVRDAMSFLQALLGEGLAGDVAAPVRKHTDEEVRERSA
jgi:ArsR family transcriptional regulator